jgi:hypothetical protein
VSSGLIVLVATSTAAAVIVVALALSMLVRAMVADASNPAEERALPAGEEPPIDLPATLVAPHVPPRRSVDVKYFRQPKFEHSEGRVGEEAERGPEPEEGVEAGGAAYRRVGEEVTAVLTAAEDAAAQIRETAMRETEQTRLAASEQAAASLAEAQARRIEANTYSEETRAAADAYAEQTRRHADETAARRVSQAEEHARLLRAEAEQAASELEAEAIRRHDALTDRIESVLSAFRGATTELEKLSAAARRSETDDPEPRADAMLERALEPASSQGQLSSYAD